MIQLGVRYFMFVQFSVAVVSNSNNVLNWPQGLRWNTQPSVEENAPSLSPSPVM